MAEIIIVVADVALVVVEIGDGFHASVAAGVVGVAGKAILASDFCSH